MDTAAPSPTRTLRIVAQDVAVRAENGRILTADVDVPAEELAPGPCGYRVHVIDYDSSTGRLYPPLRYGPGDALKDPFRSASDERLVDEPRFHAQNVYAIVMRTLARFERALGRRVSWRIRAHQLKIAPHAFADTNAFYTREDEALLFGYFPGADGKRTVFTCLSHDVVAHETTHALVDGLRERYVDPSSPDQAAFHEGFADVVALLSVFALKEIVGVALGLAPRRPGEGGGGRSPRSRSSRGRTLIDRARLTPAALRRSVLLGLAEEMGEEVRAVRGQPLRQSAVLAPSPRWLAEAEFDEPHRRGEILVAAMMNAFIAVWVKRLESLGEVEPGHLDRARVAEEGATAADHLLTMAIRALDYCVPVHLDFRGFLSALLTADHEMQPDDSRYGYRARLLESFAAYGIAPAPAASGAAGLWPRLSGRGFVYHRTHFDSLVRDSDEMFRFIWENRTALGLYAGIYTRVLSVRPCLRIDADGFALRETVAEYMQVAKLTARELARRLKIRKPDGMPGDTPVQLYGGGTLIFDEYGQLKFHVGNRLDDAAAQSGHLESLWRYGYFARGRRGRGFHGRFAALHRRRALGGEGSWQERWS